MIYRLQDGTKLFETSDFNFSPDGTLIALDEDGMYTLSNSEKLFDISGSTGTWSKFSADGAYYVASRDGIYQIADGQKLFDIKGVGLSVSFSPDGNYVAIEDDGFYRLSDQQKLFDIKGQLRGYTSDGDYVTVGYSSSDVDLGIYRLSDGHLFEHIQLLDISSGILQIGNTILVIDRTQSAQKNTLCLFRY